MLYVIANKVTLLEYNITLVSELLRSYNRSLMDINPSVSGICIKTTGRRRPIAVANVRNIICAFHMFLSMWCPLEINVLPEGER